MARCGCAQVCACAVEALSTASVLMSVTGTGAAGSPYVVSGSVILVPDEAGPLGPGVDNPLKLDALGLYVDPSLAGGGGTITSVNGDVGPAVSLGAEDIPFTPAGPLSSTDVQAALVEGATVFVGVAGAQTVAGVKTFTSDPIIPDEAFGVGWNGTLEPPTKNAVYDAIVALPTLDTTTPGALNIYTSLGVTYVDYIGSGSGGTFADNAFAVTDNIDPTKQLQFQVAGLSAGAVRTLTVPDASGTIALLTAAQTLTAKRLGRTTLIDETGTIASAPVTGVLTDDATTTLDFASAYRVATFGDIGVTIFNQSAVIAATADKVFESARTVRNASGVALSLGLMRTFRDITSIVADAAAVTQPGYAGFFSAPTLSIVGGGTLALTALNGFQANPSIGAGVTVTTANIHGSAPAVAGGVVTTLAHYKANNVTPSGGGSIATMYGVSIDALVGAAVGVGIRNASAHQEPPTARNIGAVGDSLTAAFPYAAYYQLTNTSGGSLTLTSTPTLADGQDGQVVTFRNVGAQNIVLQDQGTLAGSSLRLGAATRTLGPGDAICLRYSTALGDWYEEWFSNVV